MATKDTGGQRQTSKRSEETEEAEPQASGDVKERQEKLALERCDVNLARPDEYGMPLAIDVKSFDGEIAHEVPRVRTLLLPKPDANARKKVARCERPRDVVAGAGVK